MNPMQPLFNSRSLERHVGKLSAAMMEIHNLCLTDLALTLGSRTLFPYIQTAGRLSTKTPK